MKADLLRTLLSVIAIAAVFAASPALAQKKWTPLRDFCHDSERWLHKHGLFAHHDAVGGCQSCGPVGCSSCAAGIQGSCAPAYVRNCPSLCDQTRWWLRSEYLVWWFDGNDVPVLVSTSPQGTARAQAGVLGQPETDVLFGGEEIDEHEHYGGRWTFGYWLGDDQVTALTLGWFSVIDGQRDGSFFVQSEGDPILARPFFNVTLGAEDAQLVAFDDETVVPAVNITDGSIRIDTSNELHSASALVRRNLSLEPRRRLDWIGGYRYLRFREALAINENTVSQDPGGVVAVGTTVNVEDRFVTENDFHGGELGLMSSWQRGFATLEITSSVALGNIHQELEISGSTTVTAPGGGAPVESTGGLLAQPTNIGQHSRDEFALLPMFDATLRMAASENLHVTLGYSLVVVNDVLRTGQQIDRQINTSQFPQNGGALIGDARPAATLQDSSFWAQGVSMGLELRR